MRKFLKKRFKNERGLTLVELLAVIVILAILAIIAFVFIGGIIENSKKDAHIANAQQVIAAAKLHEASGGDPNTNASELQKQEYLDLILNPWTKDEYDDLTKVTVTTETEDKRKVYKIVFPSGEKGNCDIDASEIDLSEGDRDELCK